MPCLCEWVPEMKSMFCTMYVTSITRMYYRNPSGRLKSSEWTCSLVVSSMYPLFSPPAITLPIRRRKRGQRSNQECKDNTSAQVAHAHMHSGRTCSTLHNHITLASGLLSFCRCADQPSNVCGLLQEERAPGVLHETGKVTPTT